jgi:hypothetical protein
MIVTIYYLIPGLHDMFSFPLFLCGAGILLVGGGWLSGKVLVKRLKVQPIENYISTEVNPFTNAALTAKERVYWNAMAMLLKKEHARSPDVEIAKCVDQLNMYIKGQVPFNFDELDNFQLGETEPQLETSLKASSSKGNNSKLSSTLDIEEDGGNGSPL